MSTQVDGLGNFITKYGHKLTRLILRKRKLLLWRDKKQDSTSCRRNLMLLWHKVLEVRNRPLTSRTTHKHAKTRRSLRPTNSTVLKRDESRSYASPFKFAKQFERKWFSFLYTPLRNRNRDQSSTIIYLLFSTVTFEETWSTYDR